MSFQTLAWIGLAVVVILIVVTTDKRYNSIFKKNPNHEKLRAKAWWDALLVGVALITILPALKIPQAFQFGNTSMALGAALALFSEIDFRIRLWLANKARKDN
ncbi:hypothetical protein ACFLQV_01925 [Calditrichota bacterium]